MFQYEQVFNSLWKNAQNCITTKIVGFAKLKKTVCSTNYDVNCETQNPSKGLFNQFSNELNIKRLMITSS